MADVPDLEGADGALRDRLRKIILGYQISQCLHVAAKLGIADLLVEGPKPVEELAVATGTNPAALGRFLRLLICEDIFAVDAQGRISLTPIGRLLSSAASHSLRPAAVYWSERWMWGPWGNLAHSLRTGAPAFELVHGVSFFDFLEHTPDARALFDGFISDGLHARPRTVVESHDFSQSRVIADIGGGQGALLAEILRANPTMRGILFDRPQVLEGARNRLEDAGVMERCSIVAGNFFEQVPSGADTYLLSQIIHDWADEPARVILRNCRRVMDGGGKLFLIEQVLDHQRPQHTTALLDLTMLVILGGKERTASEYDSLFVDTGFKLVRIISTASPFSVIEAVPRRELR
jgi:ubiquinone/menaquinone biosynthesis C-methylase UbiE